MPTGRLPIAGGETSSPATTTTIEDLHSDVLARTLRLLDGPTLAAVGSTTCHLRSLATNSDIWLHLCLSTWPSLRDPRLLPHLSAAPRSFFSDAFPFPAPHTNPSPVPAVDLPAELISAVDLYHRGVLIFSKVLETETSSPWFRGSPFRIDAVDEKKEAPLFPGVVISPKDLILKWVLFDRVQGRAVDVSSRRAVALDRHWYTGETIARFTAAATADGKMIAAAVTCGEWRGEVREIALTAEDVDGACVNGEEGLRAVRAAMGGGRRWRGGGEKEEEDFRERYLEFLGRKRRRKESRARREGVVDLCCTAVGAAVFVVFLALFVFR